MEAGQIMMAQASPQTAVTASVSSETSAVSASNQVFGSMLGQTMGQQGQDPALSGQVSEALILGGVSIFSELSQEAISGFFEVQNADVPEQTPDSRDVSKEASDVEQILGQTLAGYLQAAMIAMPVQPSVATGQSEPVLSEPVSETPQAVEEMVSSVSLPLPDMTEVSDDVKGDADVEVPLAVEAGKSDKIVVPENPGQKMVVSDSGSARIMAALSEAGNKAVIQPEQKEDALLQQNSQALAVASGDKSQSLPDVAPENVPEKIQQVAESVTIQKPQPTQANQFRFAQQPDMVAAMAEPMDPKTGDDAGLSRDNGGELGKQLSMAKVAGEKTSEMVGNEAQLASQGQLRQMDNGMAALQVNRQATVHETQPVSDAPVVGTAEQVGRQVADKLAAHQMKPGNDQIFLKLSPEHLGNLQLNLRMDDQKLRIDVVTEHRNVRDALLQQVDELKETLARQNIKMESFNVTTGNNGGLTQQQGDWRQAYNESRPQQFAYAAAGKGGRGGLQDVDVPTNYFAPQYQSTIDVRF